MRIRVSYDIKSLKNEINFLKRVIDRKAVEQEQIAAEQEQIAAEQELNKLERTQNKLKMLVDASKYLDTYLGTRVYRNVRSMQNLIKRQN